MLWLLFLVGASGSQRISIARAFLKDAPIMHDIVCDRKDMEKEVRKFLGI